MRKRKRQVVKKLIQCATVIAAGVLAIILFMWVIWYRGSGVPDEVTVVFAEDVPYRACSGIEFDVMQEFVEGSRLLLTGKTQTLKDFQSGRLLVYILADFVAVSEKAVEQDEVAVRGIKRTIKKCESGKITKEQLQKSIQSWTGHAGHADSYNLRKKIETLAEAAIEKAA